MRATGNDVTSGFAVEWRMLRRGPLEWFLLTGNRIFVGATLLLVVAGAIWGVVLTGLAPLQERTPMLYLLFALISGNFALITIVVSISQFVLSRHLESPEEIRQRMNEMVGYRREVGEVAHRSVLPITHLGFLAVLFQSISRLVDDLEQQSSSIGDEHVRREITRLVAELGPHAEYVTNLLEESESSMKSALFATLNASYATCTYDAWHLVSERGETLPEATRDGLEKLLRGLEQVEVARRFFKTVLIQSELASLSRLLLFVGLPVQLGTVVIMLLFTATSGVGVSPTVLSIIIPLIVTLGFAPIVLLAAYILRLATVVHRTAAMYPFTDRLERASTTVDDDLWEEQPSAVEENGTPR